jgi:hypothetical protein
MAKPSERDVVAKKLADEAAADLWSNEYAGLKTSEVMQPYIEKAMTWAFMAAVHQSVGGEPLERDNKAAADLLMRLRKMAWTSESEDAIAQALAEARAEERKAIVTRIKWETENDSQLIDAPCFLDWLEARDKGETT